MGKDEEIRKEVINIKSTEEERPVGLTALINELDEQGYTTLSERAWFEGEEPVGETIEEIVGEAMERGRVDREILRARFLGDDKDESF